MTSPRRDPIEEPGAAGHSPPGRRAGRRIGVLAGALALLATAGVVVVAVAARSSAPTPSAAETTSAAPASALSPDSVSPASPSGTGAPAPAPTSTCADKFGVCMTDAQNAETRVELTALAGRLPANLSLTAPATWAQWAGTTPTYADDIVSCPHIADRLAADLGGRWTYTYGKLPTDGCTWTPVPWIPDRPPAERFFVSIGYQSGPTGALLDGPDYCAGGVTAPRIAVPAVRPGAVLDGCHDGYQHTFLLAFPDTAGTGVWFLSTWGGVDQPQTRPADALPALIDAATRAYG